jgi:hypothetical protein
MPYKCVSFHNSIAWYNRWEVISTSILQATERRSCQVDTGQKSMVRAG